MIAATLNVLIAMLGISAMPLPLAELTRSAMSMAWGLVIFCIILGAMITLAPNKRTSEIKRPSND